MIVIDASAVLELLLNTPATLRISQRVFADGETLHAPHLLDLEVAQVLRRYAAAGELDTARGVQALEDLADLPLTRYPHALFLLRIWELRHNATAYDAAYLSLAEALDAPLITRDGAMASMPGTGPESLCCDFPVLTRSRGQLKSCGEKTSRSHRRGAESARQKKINTRSGKNSRQVTLGESGETASRGHLDEQVA